MNEQEKLLQQMEENMPFLLSSLVLRAKILKGFYDALVHEGFSEDQALSICLHELSSPKNESTPAPLPLQKIKFGNNVQ